ncbi:unnamed protein product [Fraxinus pennsylvanica]|uniref:Ankyrin repeat protein n=1 Tax=Fraxinus pennsylvanica TaxID=56036 RepID=A0AAD2AB54_9LAMI|nr:unnamed protein product [Fraxinus pennsylvanica]
MPFKHSRHITTVKRHVRHDPDLIRVPGRGGITPLHYAAESDDNINLLIRFLIVYQSSIKDVTIRDEPAVHIAVRNKNLRGFKVMKLLIGIVDVNAKNSEDNTGHGYRRGPGPTTLK